MTIKLELGKSYITRNGRSAKIIDECLISEQFEVDYDGHKLCIFKSDNGHVYKGKEDDLDLISEVA